jgi:hypothetical protein
MSFISRKHCGNLGGLSHLTGNFCLLAKGMITTMLAGQVLDFHPLLTQWPATLSGLIFLIAASLLAIYGHRAKGFLLGNGLAILGYGVLGVSAILTHGSIATFLGLAIGIISASFALAAANRFSFRFLSINTRYLNRRFKKAFAASLENFPFWPSGAIEFTADTALLAGAITTGDGAMIIIASLWAFGSILIGSASPVLAKI